MKSKVCQILMTKEGKESLNLHILPHSFSINNSTQKTMKCEAIYNNRNDIVNRALLRSIKRFYYEEFKKDNKRIVKKRFKQVLPKVMFNGFKRTCHRLFGDMPNLDIITQFVMIIS